MQIDANDVISKLAQELSQATQRAILAEVRAETAENRIAELENTKEEN